MWKLDSHGDQRLGLLPVLAAVRSRSDEHGGRKVSLGGVILEETTALETEGRGVR